MSETLTLGLAQPHEAERIAQMSRDLIEAGLGWSWTPERVLRHIANRHCSVVVARSDRHIAGFALMQFAEETAHLNLLAVLPAWRRQGCAKRLLEWLFATAEVAGIRRINLELRAGNAEARGFYEACGFRVTGSRPNYYQGTESALTMTRGEPDEKP